MQVTCGPRLHTMSVPRGRRVILSRKQVKYHCLRQVELLHLQQIHSVPAKKCLSCGHRLVPHERKNEVV